MNPLITKILISAATKYLLPRLLEGAEKLVKRRAAKPREKVSWEGAKLGATKREIRKAQRKQALLIKRAKRAQRLRDMTGQR